MSVSRQGTNRPTYMRLVSGVAFRVQKYPALAGGATALFVMISLISANAVWYQPAHHPAPIFATRSNDGASNTTVRHVSAIQVTKPTASVELNSVQPKPQIDELTKELQLALADKNIYSGAIDGIYGSRTKTAIMAYQEKKQLKSDGKVSAKLLSHILMSGTAVVRVPVPPVQPIALPGALNNNDGSVTHSKQLVSAIQAGLKNYGYDDIIIDGVMGSQTSSAIKRFELDYGLQITGEASRVLLNKLKDIGATGRG